MAPSPGNGLTREAIQSCRCDNPAHALAPASADLEVAAVADYIAARRAELARQAQCKFQRRQAENAEYERLYAEREKKKQAAKAARQQKREREEREFFEKRHGPQQKRDALPASTAAGGCNGGAGLSVMSCSGGETDSVPMTVSVSVTGDGPLSLPSEFDGVVPGASL